MNIPSPLKHLAPDAGQHRIARSLTVRGMGLIYLIALLSWWSQATFLVGQDGLMPAKRIFDWLGQQPDSSQWINLARLPSWLWFTGTSDAAFHTLCLLGCLASLLILCGRFTGPALLLVWTIYLSLLNAGSVFMSFQWDILLLEAGFLLLFFAPWTTRLSWRNPPPLHLHHKIALLFLWFLIAKLMFLSGWVKLAWAGENHPEWWPDGTAMTYHYMTQPLPTWSAWWMHQLPASFHRFSLWPMYVVEIILPFAILLGRWGRLLAAGGFIGLMLLVSATGNYTYFNWLTIVLSLPLVHDRFWPAPLRRVLRTKLSPENPAETPRSWKPVWAAAPFYLLLFLLNFHIVCSDLHRAPKPLLAKNWSPPWLESLHAATAPFRLASGYGLFRTMTTERPEIILEGSDDGLQWFAYDFFWKPDELDERPLRVAPHQPRLAWQFWFAALEPPGFTASNNLPWIETLVTKLLQGDPAVKVCLRRDPFPGNPPRYIRGRLYRYTFTNREERRETGHWWKREWIREYFHPVSLPPAP